MSNEFAAVVTTYEAELIGAGRISRDDRPLDERKASDRSQGLQTTSRREWDPAPPASIRHFMTGPPKGNGAPEL